MSASNTPSILNLTREDLEKAARGEPLDRRLTLSEKFFYYGVYCNPDRLDAIWKRLRKHQLEILHPTETEHADIPR